MPLVALNSLPTYGRLKAEGAQVLSPTCALPNNAKPLRIGLLNLMPDAALEATERQFMRLAGGSEISAQVHLFTMPELERGPASRAHIAAHYETFAEIQTGGLDALMISGANVLGNALEKQPFWKSLAEVVDWSVEQVASTLCSCLATHAVMQFRYGQTRVALAEKRWGVYEHRLIDVSHGLVSGLPTGFAVPHSRFNEVTAAQFVAAGAKVLIESEAGEVHLAVSEDSAGLVFFQGHPEYDAISLLKEYKREVSRFAAGELSKYPPFPENVFSARAREILKKHEDEVRQAAEPPSFPEAQLAAGLANSWRKPAQQVFDNWLGSIRDARHR